MSLKCWGRNKLWLTHFDNSCARNLNLHFYCRCLLMFLKSDRAWVGEGLQSWVEPDEYGICRAHYSLSLKCFLKCAGNHLASVWNHLGNFHQWAPNRAPWPAHLLLAPPPRSHPQVPSSCRGVSQPAPLADCSCSTASSLPRETSVAIPAQLSSRYYLHRHFIYSHN